MESRTKEALRLGDLDLALERALAVVDIDPYDSKRGWSSVRSGSATGAGLGRRDICIRSTFSVPAQALLRATWPRSASVIAVSRFWPRSSRPPSRSTHWQYRLASNRGSARLAALTALKEWNLRSFRILECTARRFLTRSSLILEIGYRVAEHAVDGFALLARAPGRARRANRASLRARAVDISRPLI